MNRQTNNKIKRILVIQTAFLGDLIMSTPIFKALKEIWPNALIDVLVIPETASVLGNNPYIHNIYCFDKRKKINKLKSFIPLILRLGRNNYEIAFSVQSSYTSSLIMFLAGIRTRVGYSKQKLLTNKITQNKNLHIRDRVLLLIKEFSNILPDNETKIFLDDQIKAKIKLLTKNDINKKKIAIAPGSVWATKKWPENYFIELIKMLKEHSIYLIGGPDDKVLCQRILNNSEHNNITNFAGELSIIESSTLISMMELTICNDSGPLHMANAVETPVFAFFGPTVKAFGCYPYRENDRLLEVEMDCRPCSKHGRDNCPKKHHKCMINITPDHVYTQIEDFFSARKN